MATSPDDSLYSKNMTLLLEFQQLCASKIDGLLVHPSDSDPNDCIDGTLLVHSGYWTGAKINFTLTLPHSLFGTSIRVNTPNVFHPLVSPDTGAISELHTTKTPSTNSSLLPLAHRLHRIFNAPLAQVIGSSATVLNQEAATLFQDNKEAFAKRIKQSLKLIEEEIIPSPYSVATPQTWTNEHEELLSRLKSDIVQPVASQ